MVVIKFVVLFAFIGLASAKVKNNSSSTLQDYITQNERQYNAVLQNYETALAAYRLNFEQRIQTIYTQRELVANKIADALAKINPLEVLNAKSKMCVRQYQDGIPSAERVQTTITTCATSAVGYINNYLSSPVTTRTALRNYYNINFKNLLTDCERKFANSTLNYTLCVTQVITTVNTYTINNKKTFDASLQQSQCSGDTRIKQALTCSFNAVHAAITNIAESVSSIEHCIAAEPIDCDTCLKTSPDAVCHEVMHISLHTDDYKKATISNPFKGLEAHTPCVLFHLERELELGTNDVK